LPVRPEIGAAIRLSLPAHDALVLGEVRYCVSLENEFLIGVQFDQILTNLTELANLNQEFLGAYPLKPVSSVPPSTGRTTGEATSF
jgi:hypothetical protein